MKDLILHWFIEISGNMSKKCKPPQITLMMGDEVVGGWVVWGGRDREGAPRASRPPAHTQARRVGRRGPALPINTLPFVSNVKAKKVKQKKKKKNRTSNKSTTPPFDCRPFRALYCATLSHSSIKYQSPMLSLAAADAE